MIVVNFMTTENNFKISLAALLLILIIIVAGVGFFMMKQNNPVQKITPIVNTITNSTAQQISDEMPIQSLSKDGIDVVVDKVERKNDLTTVRVVMNNHRYDLSDSAIQDRTTFNGIPASSFEILSSEMGGHHVEVNLIFQGEVYGTFSIGATDDIILDFELL